MSKQISPLRQRMIDDMAFRNMSPNTQKIYAYAVARFARFHHQSPDKLGLEHVRDYRLHLMSRGLKTSSIILWRGNQDEKRQAWPTIVRAEPGSMQGPCGVPPCDCRGAAISSVGLSPGQANWHQLARSA